MVPGLHSLRDRFDAVLLDLDGTLLDGHGNLTPRTKRAVRALVDAGFFVMLCTGRGVPGTMPHQQALGLQTPMVTYNGSWIGHVEGDPQHYLPIPDVHIDALIAAEQEAHFAFRHKAEWKYTVMTDHPEHVDVARWFDKVVRAAAHHELPANDLMRMSLFVDRVEVAMAEFEARFWQRMPDHAREALRIEIFPLSLFPTYENSSMVLFEIQGDSHGKAEALYWLEREHGIPPSRTIAIGDHVNDLTMLEEAGLAVTPANGVPEAKRRAHVVIGHHAAEGVAEWVEQGAPHEPDAKRNGDS